jgi:hypothetical protein
LRLLFAGQIKRFLLPVPEASKNQRKKCQKCCNITCRRKSFAERASPSGDRAEQSWDRRDGPAQPPTVTRSFHCCVPLHFQHFEQRQKSPTNKAKDHEIKTFFFFSRPTRRSPEKQRKIPSPSRPISLRFCKTLNSDAVEWNGLNSYFFSFSLLRFCCLAARMLQKSLHISSSCAQHECSCHCDTVDGSTRENVEEFSCPSLSLPWR